MKCRCPACGRTTQVPQDLLHFFTRCDRCAILLKPFIYKDLGGDPTRSGLAAKIVPVGRVRETENTSRLALADLLSQQPLVPKSPPKIEKIVVVERKKSPLENRHKAIQKAQLRGTYRILGTLSVVGLFVLGILTLAALFLKSHLFQASSAHAGILHEHPAFSTPSNPRSSP